MRKRLITEEALLAAKEAGLSQAEYIRASGFSRISVSRAQERYGITLPHGKVKARLAREERKAQKPPRPPAKQKPLPKLKPAKQKLSAAPAAVAKAFANVGIAVPDYIKERVEAETLRYRGKDAPAELRVLYRDGKTFEEDMGE